MSAERTGRPYTVGVGTLGSAMTLPDRSGPRAVASRPLPTSVVAGVVVQCCQALVWMASGLVIGLGDGLRPDDPNAVVLAIAGILVVSTGGFGLALAAGTISRSEECRVVSAVLQLVFAALLLAAALDTRPGGMLSVLLDPAARLAAPLTLIMPVSCLVVAILLLLPRARTTAVTNRPDQLKSAWPRVTTTEPLR
ncbi:MAG TPA: hypothetical protein VH333_14940 [Pseudonocardiaceae bacterium]|nr:hypothetical protein [Pseudonocardiaceae bacterium]